MCADAAPTPAPWFYHAAFRRYWDHWRHVQTWLRATEVANEKAEKDKNATLRRLGVGRGSSGRERGGVANENREQMRAQRRKKQKRKKKREAKRTKSRKEEEEEEDGVDDGENPIEASSNDQDEFLKLLRQNQAFREQRDAYKRQEEENARKKDISSSQTPKEQAGVKRTREMGDLYGPESILVQTLETKLQMKFDEYADLHQPPLWPSIPLNLSYGR